MGLAPAEVRNLTPTEFHEIQQGWIEAHGGQTARTRARSRAELDHLKRLYPDSPTAGSA